MDLWDTCRGIWCCCQSTCSLRFTAENFSSYFKANNVVAPKGQVQPWFRLGLFQHCYFVVIQLFLKDYFLLIRCFVTQPFLALEFCGLWNTIYKLNPVWVPKLGHLDEMEGALIPPECPGKYISFWEHTHGLRWTGPVEILSFTS